MRRAGLAIAILLALAASAAARGNRAAIDIGSSSIKLLVVDSHGKTVADVKIGAGLGKKIGPDGRLPAKNQDRAVKALRRLIDRAAEHGVEAGDIEVIATAAVRNAGNGHSFLEHQLKRDLGLTRARILTGPEEAALGYRGAMKGWSGDPAQRLVVVDVGGGSHQVVVAKDGRIEAADSTQVGSHQVAEQAMAGRDLEAADRRLAKMVPTLPVQGARGETTLLIGGTAKFLHHYFRSKTVSLADVERLRKEASERDKPIKRDVDGDKFGKREREMLGLHKNGGKNAASLTAKLTLVLRLMNLAEVRTLHLTDTDARHALLE